MEYEYQKTEYDLTLEEQDKAAFIRKTAYDANVQIGRQGTVLSSLERAAFEEFKNDFYSEVHRRLDFSGWGLYSPVFTISDDGRKLIRYQVVPKKEEKEAK